FVDRSRETSRPVWAVGRSLRVSRAALAYAEMLANGGQYRSFINATADGGVPGEAPHVEVAAPSTASRRPHRPSGNTSIVRGSNERRRMRRGRIEAASKMPAAQQSGRYRSSSGTTFAARARLSGDRSTAADHRLDMRGRLGEIRQPLQPHFLGQP